MLNRRGFLSFLGVGVATAAVAPAALLPNVEQEYAARVSLAFNTGHIANGQFTLLDAARASDPAKLREEIIATFTRENEILRTVKWREVTDPVWHYQPCGS